MSQESVYGLEITSNGIGIFSCPTTPEIVLGPALLLFNDYRG
jgi:hypothetical protein